MLPLDFKENQDRPLKILCLGAHSDDIELGCGGTILRLLSAYPKAEVYWQVFSASGARALEAQRAAKRFLAKAHARTVVLAAFQDGYFPSERTSIKDAFEELKGQFAPDLIFTHHRNDAHQDHRLVAELTWNTWRHHMILEYEIPKYDADLGHPNVFVPVSKVLMKRKIQYLLKSFPSQQSRQWFDAETFQALLRLRGLEADSPSRYAEAFHAPKLRLFS